MLTVKSYPQYEFSMNVDSICQKINGLNKTDEKRV